MDTATITQRLADRFGCACDVVTRAPGRLNLIGEHTDYNEGFAMPIALPQSTWVAAARRSDGRVAVFSELAEQPATWGLADSDPAVVPSWARYVMGVAAGLLARGARLPGFYAYITSDVPVGAGLSSSAALAVAAALALAYLAGEPLESRETIELCRTAEHDFAGVPCGILDPTASLLCQADRALLLDCRLREGRYVPVCFDDAALVLVDSGQRRELAEGAYALRQRECQAALAYYRWLDPNVRALRDVSAATARAHVQQLEPPLSLRAMHVTSENERTLAAADLLEAGDAAGFGKLLSASHQSLSQLFEVSTPAVDRLVRTLATEPGVLGARMVGGGFGGSILALVRRTRLNDIISQCAALTPARYPNGQAALAISPGPGAAVVFGR